MTSQYESDYYDLVRATVDPDWLHELGMATWLATRLCVAANAHTAARTLATMAARRSVESVLLAAIAAHPATTATTIAQLSHHHSAQVRAAAVRHPHMSADRAAELLTDADRGVWLAACGRLAREEHP